MIAIQRQLDKVLTSKPLREGHILEFPDRIAFLLYLLKTEKSYRLAQTGFNSGHSACLLLSYAYPDANLTSFDLGEHDYVEQCGNIINQSFKGHHELILGDSRQTLPSYKGSMWDFCLVDGGHAGRIPLDDMINFFDNITQGGIMVVDDLDMPNVRNCWEIFLNDYLPNHRVNFEMLPNIFCKHSMEAIKFKI